MKELILDTLPLLIDQTPYTSSSKKPGTKVSSSKSEGLFCVELLPLNTNIEQVFESSLAKLSDKKVRKINIDVSNFSLKFHNENEMNNYLDNIILRPFFDRVSEVHNGGDMEIPYIITSRPDFQVLCHKKLSFIEMKLDNYFNTEDNSNYINLFFIQTLGLFYLVTSWSLTSNFGNGQVTSFDWSTVHTLLVMLTVFNYIPNFLYLD
jgi:hypothetical protein